VSEHLDLDALADLLAGEGSEGDRQHRDSCADCRARLAELEAALPAVTASLARLAVPLEPADLAGRLDAALAAEAAGGAIPARGTADVLPLAARPRARWLPALAGVAAVAVLVTGGVLVTQSGTGTGTGDDNGSTAAGPSFPRTSSGRDYTQATLPGAVPALLRGEAPATALSFSRSADATGSSEGMPATADPLVRLRTSEGLAACLTSVLDPASDELPLALDYAAYQGKPALLVLLATDQPTTVDVFVVGAGCDQRDADLLYFARVTPPS